MNASRRAGFTIIELMMVVAILGVFAGLAAPSMADLLASTAVKGAASDFYASLIAARSEAIKRRTNATVAPIGADWTTGWTVKVGTNVFQQVDPLKTRVVVNPTTPVPIVFAMNGRVSSGAQTIKFSDSVRTTVANRCVIVGTSGLPRVRTGC
jgi:prepilin-type N-terminal cleavage/methylation domain-containing protein